MIITVDHVTKKIRSACVVDDVTLNFVTGTVYGLRGPNGSGKTMLLRLLSGLILPTNGTVTVDGMVMGRDMPFPPNAGVLIEAPSFLGPYDGARNLSLLAGLTSVQKSIDVKKVLEDVGLDPASRKPYRKYSLGMKQRLGIAAAIMGEPDLILLDEPTNALDAAGIAVLASLIQRESTRGALLIIASHEKDFLESVCDEIVCMQSGKVISIDRGE